MPDMLTEKMQSYYNSLPEAIKTAITESGAKITTLEDLKAVARELGYNEQ